VFGILKGRFRFIRHGILLQSQEKVDTIFFTCCILHNLILEADGLDKRWEENVEWDRLNPQPSNSDTGFDEEDGPRVHSIGLRELHILERVDRYRSATDNEDFNGNEVVEEIDEHFESKRKLLIDHFKKAYDSGLVCWPRCFPLVKKRIYNVAH
jgi:hypothetical protein